MSTPHKRMLKRGAFVVVDGNISAGKSRYVDALAKAWRARGANVEVLKEQNDDPMFEELLRRYYKSEKDRKRWALTLQVYAMALRSRQHRYAAVATSLGRNVIQDRSIYADSCFGRVCVQDGAMDDVEWEIYSNLFGAFCHDLAYPDALIYLQASPERCCKANDHRAEEEEGRDMEAGIPLDYLRDVDEQHEEMVIAVAPHTRVIRVDWEAFGGARMVNQHLNRLLVWLSNPKGAEALGIAP